MSQQQHQVAPHAATELAIKPSINTLAQGSMFWQPDYREPSAWLEHLPFLFWLIEALRPQQSVGLGVDDVAHFAVCQAASRLRLGTRCYMVGDDVKNKQDAEAIRAYAADHFATTSQWLETSPTRAIEQFDEGSVDLLLLHLEADDNSVDYLLDRWLSKLSSQGLVIVPGVARREPGCLVFRAFDTIKARYPHFVFHHAGGLGVIAVGNELPPLVNNLLGALESNASTQVVQDVFARLGRSCQDKVTVRQQQALFQSLEARVTEQANSLADAEQTITHQAEQLRQADDERGKLKSRLEQQEARFAHERGRLAEQVSALEEFKAELKKELMRQREQSERYAAETSDHAQAAKESGQLLNQAQQQLEAKVNQLAEQNKQLAEKDKQLEEQDKQLAEKDKQLAEKDKQLEANDTQLEEKDKELLVAREENAQLTSKLEQTEHSLADAQSQVLALRNRGQALEGEVKETKQMLDTRFSELAKLTNLLEANEQSLREAHEESAELTRKLQKTDASLQARFNELGQLTRKLQEAEQRISEGEKNRADIEQQMARQKTTYEKEQAALSAQLKALAEREKAALGSVDERFSELAVLTDLLEKNEAQREQLARDLAAANDAATMARQKWEADAKANRETQAQQRREIERQAHELADLVSQLEAQRNNENNGDTASLTVAPVVPSVAKPPPLTKRAIKRQAALIEASQWFDAKWYLAQYPDIASDAKMSANPARHYLLMGGFEGRNPGPGFDSAYYLAHNPDVVESGINPLIHYLKFGEKEQRSVKGQ
ncbi:MAG: hypothetical protein ACTIDY_14370 [Halomonadaceae bacterium]|uniref:Chromosome partition protein Smc n=1 Tax=Halomonas colorata TaxID=2742615 RepID=A0ABR9G280_9GAMM|nr:hypothetical protein [Halomonas colorata]MBE0465002.1 hypothetical protein [Halomonas colorata]